MVIAAFGMSMNAVAILMILLFVMENRLRIANQDIGFRVILKQATADLIGRSYQKNQRRSNVARIRNRNLYWGFSRNAHYGIARCRIAWIEGFIIGVMVGGAILYGLIQFWGG